MKMMIRIGLALVVLLAVAVGVLAFGVPRLVESPQFRDTLAEQVKAVTGSDFHYEKLSFGWLPPRLEIAAPRLAGATESAPALFEAKRGALRLALMPLFRSEVQVTLVELEGADLRLVQTKDGITIETGVPLPTGGDEEVESESAVAAFEIEKVALRDTNVTLVDRTSSPVVTWQLTDFDADISSIGGAAPLEVKASAQSLRGGDIALDGEFRVTTKLAPPLGTLKGPFEIDLDDTAIRVGDSFRKKKGTKATFKGQLVERAGGVLGIDGKLTLYSLDAPIEVDLGDRTTVRIPSGSVALEGWGELVPSVASLAPSGTARFQGFTAKLTPMALSGGIELDGVEVEAIAAEAGAPAQRVLLRGAIEGSGRDGIKLNGLKATLPGGVVDVGGSLSKLETSPRYDLSLDTPTPLDSNPLFSAMAHVVDLVFGPLALDVKLQGPLESLLEQTQGHMQFALGGDQAGGRLKGVSLLGDTLTRLDSLATTAALISGRKNQSGKLQKYLGDEFKLLGGRFDVSQGIARTQDLRLEYRGYTVNLRGAMGLLDGSLDMTGTIVLDPEVDQLITGGNKRRTIDLAHLRGTVSSPEIGISASAIAGSVVGQVQREVAAKVDKQAAKGIAQGTEKLQDGIDKGLRNLFGKKKKKQEAPVAPVPAATPDAPSGNVPAEVAP